MRDIKFRGKRIDNGGWVAGHYLTRRDKDGLKHMISTQDMWGFFEVDPKTVGQFSEVHDEENIGLFGKFGGKARNVN